MHFVWLLSLLAQLAYAGPSCREHIREVICLAEPPSENETPETRRCPPAPQYAHFFEKLYDRYPVYLQKMFCHLEKIFVEKQWQGSSYAGVFYSKTNPEEVRSGFVGIRRQLLDRPSGAADWASWKEQVSFGTSIDHVNQALGLPRVDTSLGGQEDMLFFTITHELGHVFDFTNHLNRYTECSGPYGNLKGKCTAAKGSWAALGWRAYNQPLDREEFTLRSKICSYFCGGNFLPASQQDELYTELSKTMFLTPYASRATTEDFAETFVFYHLWKLRHGSYRIITADGSEYDVMAKLLSRGFEPKRRFVENFLAGPILYPGE